MISYKTIWNSYLSLDSDKNNDSAASDDEEIPSDIADSEDDQPAEAEKPRAKKRPAEDNESRQQNEKKLKIHNEHSRTSEDFYRKFLSFRLVFSCFDFVIGVILFWKTLMSMYSIRVEV